MPNKVFFDSIAAAGDNLVSIVLRSTGETGEKSLLFMLEIAAKINLKRILKDTDSAGAVQEKLLLDILQLQKDTDYGSRHDFSAIRNVSEFLSRHPLTSYDDYGAAIKDIASTGNFTQLVSEPITLYQETSGTTGRVKLIPRTNSLSIAAMQSFQATESVAQKYFQKLSQVPQAPQRGLALVNTSAIKSTPSGVPRGTGTSGGLSDALKKFKLASDLVSIKYSSPPEIFLIPDNESAYYCHLLFGLLDKKLSYIAANFAANVLEAVQILEKYWQQLVADVRWGQLYKGLNLDESTRQRLQRCLQADPNRATELESLFTRGFAGILPRIWPHLCYIQCITTGSMRLYYESLKYYAGAVDFYSGGYAASEAWIGINLDPDRELPAYVVTPHSAVFEFIPEQDIDQPQPDTLSLTSLKIGENYEIVVTTVAGLYRYRLGDVIKCVGHYNQSPIIEFLYRRKTLLNLVGEKVSENIVLTALTTATKNLGVELQIVDYTCRHHFTDSPWRYVIYVESTDASQFAARLEECQRQMDQALCSLSSRYRELREAGRIGSLHLKLLGQGAFSALKSRLLSQGHSDSQFKMPRLITDSSLINFLEDRLYPEQAHEKD